MAHPHDALFWVHFASAAVGVVIYLALVLIFRRFARDSLHRPTCIALCWIFAALAGLLAAHTVAQLVAGLEEVLSYVDIGTRVVVAAAMVGIHLDTRRDAFAAILGQAGRGTL